MTETSNPAERPRRQWPAWIDDVLLFGPIAELEVEWRAAIGDAITDVLDRRAVAREDRGAVEGREDA